jgi:hypothetical protein
LTIHRFVGCFTLAAHLALLFIHFSLTALLRSCCATLHVLPFSSEAAQVSHVTTLAGKHVALTINGDEVTLHEVAADATAAAHGGASKEQHKVWMHVWWVHGCKPCLQRGPLAHVVGSTVMSVETLGVCAV